MPTANERRDGTRTSAGGAPRAPARAASSAVAPATACVALVAALLLGACGTLTSTGRVDVDAAAPWALLTIDNLSSTPLAGRKAAALLETRLRARGVRRIGRHAPGERSGLVALLDDGPTPEEGEEWARARGYRYALGGTVHEWRYKSAPDLEPVVGLSLRLADATSGEVLWQGSASKSGWGNASLSGVADEVIGELLEELRVRVGTTGTDVAPD